MPEANDSEVAGAAVLPPKTNGQPQTRREQKAQARESREDAINRAFGDLPADDLLGDDPAAVSEQQDDVDADDSESLEKADAADLRSKYDDLLGKYESLEARLVTERTRQEEPEEIIEVEPTFDIEVPEGWESIKPTLVAIKKQADESTRAVKKDLEAQIRQNNLMRAELDLAKFGAQHPDFWQPVKPGGPRLCDVIAQTATKKSMDLYDFESINTMYDYVRGQLALQELGQIKKKQTVQAEMSQKAGAVPRHRSTQQQVRDDQVAPGNRLLSFDEAFEKSKQRILRGRPR